jgi:hypothetical protein
LLNRLASEQNAGTDCTVNVLGGNKKFWGNTYAYDAWGNLINKTKIGTACAGENLSLTADAHNWIHATGGSDYQYDAVGNMTFNATPPTRRGKSAGTIIKDRPLDWIFLKINPAMVLGSIREPFWRG